jgi:beta-fructofuranosidase
MFDRPDLWVWDSWLVDDGTEFHLFHLQAPKSLGDAELRHRNASIGHAVSPDLVGWVSTGSVLGPQRCPAFDDLATWTGCVVGGDPEWSMFATGLSVAEDGLVQRIGRATSTDLRRWERSAEPMLEADPRWYAVRDQRHTETHWRDPWVVSDGAGRQHMYITARDPDTAMAVVGHAVADGVDDWAVEPPLCPPSARFGWVEVPSLQQVNGRWFLVFSCLSDHMPGAPTGSGGVWSLPVFGPGAPFDLDGATRLACECVYAGRIVRGRDGSSYLLAFVNADPAGRFVGGIIDPVPVSVDAGTGDLRLAGPPVSWCPHASLLPGARFCG